MHTRRFSLALCLPLVFATLAAAQAPSASEARLLKDLQLLAGEACEGRGITTKGIDLAADYIERQFIQAGAQPGGPDGSYSQRFTLATEAALGKNNELVLKGPLGQTITLAQGRDFTVLLQGGSGKAEAPLVFAGYGLTSTNPEYDDYKGLDVAGKVVIVLGETPRRGHPNADLFTIHADPGANPSSLRTKAENARKHKAAGLLVVNPRSRVLAGDFLPKSIFSMGDFAPWHMPMAHVPRSLVDAILVSATGERLTEIERRIDADFHPRSAPLAGWSCRFETDVAYKTLPVRNIIGVIEGAGPLAKETVVVGAHYDHVGNFGTTRRFPGMVKGVSAPGGIGGAGLPLALVNEPALHHGADDNASGTSVLMELARRFGAQKDRQGRRIVLIAFTAEESGLLGSRYYVEHPVVPLADTVTMINLDMVGRLQDDKLLVGGLGAAKDFEPLIDRLNAKHGFKLMKEPSGFAPSDNASFYTRKIPAIWFFTGFHEQYHRPSDRVETLNVPGLARIAALVGDTAAELASMPSRPEYQKTAGFDRSKTLWAMAPSIGLVPVYADKESGVLVDSVFKDTAADKAGVKKGDRIRKLGAHAIANATAFHALTRTLMPGERVAMLVERDGKELTLSLALAPPSTGFTDPMLGFIVNPGQVKDGATVLGVVADGPAAKAGMKKGDRILSISGEPLRDRDAYFNVIRALRAGDAVDITLLRGKEMLKLRLETKK